MLVIRVVLKESSQMKPHNVSEDSRPHEVDHLGHRVDVHHALVLELLQESEQRTERSCCHTTISADTQATYSRNQDLDIIKQIHNK